MRAFLQSGSSLSSFKTKNSIYVSMLFFHNSTSTSNHCLVFCKRYIENSTQRRTSWVYKRSRGRHISTTRQNKAACELELTMPKCADDKLLWNRLWLKPIQWIQQNARSNKHMTDCTKGMMCFQSYVSSSKKKRQGQRNASSIHIVTTLPTCYTTKCHPSFHMSYASSHGNDTSLYKNQCSPPRHEARMLQLQWQWKQFEKESTGPTKSLALDPRRGRRTTDQDRAGPKHHLGETLQPATV